LKIIAFLKVLLPQNETLATPLANAQLIYMNKFLCILETNTKPILLSLIIHDMAATLNINFIIILESTLTLGLNTDSQRNN